MRIYKTIKLAIFLAGSSTALATGINIPDNSFESISATVSAPKSLGVTVMGTNSINFGLWTGLAGASVIGLTPGTITVGTAASLGGPTPLDGSYEARLSMGAGVGTFLSVRQTLSTAFNSYSTYHLSLGFDAGANVSLLSQASLNLMAGNNSIASLSGNSLITAIGNSGNYQTIGLDFTTGAIAPTGNIGIEFDVNSVLNLGANFYLDDARLSIVTAPEPHPGMLIGAGLGMFALLSRFKKKNI
ncbi:MAG TPA: hypothetical protein VG347_14095 [Verrucomicrobiae bacterium]|nr:hypothetical protein [Verrucomicrobiae bacterium]